jgi:hypothetical protein
VAAIGTSAMSGVVLFVLTMVSFDMQQYCFIGVRLGINRVM